MVNIASREKLATILDSFGISAAQPSIEPIGNGLINSTFKVSTHQKSIILQKINQSVFPEPKKVLDNADRINQYLTNLKEAGKYDLALIPQIKTMNGSNHRQYSEPNSAQTEYWRALTYIENSRSFDSINSKALAIVTAKAFGYFSKALLGMNQDELEPVIPKFHDLNFRLQQLNAAIEGGSKQKIDDVKNLIEFINSQVLFIRKVEAISLRLPQRITHNDTKISNLLFSSLSSSKAIAVIDLDTCMPGFLMNDFGDMVRTCCSNIAEDSRELSKMAIQFDRFEGLATGYIGDLKNCLDKNEALSLVLGAQLLPFISGIRFLTDYLNSDVYFRTEFPTHNKVRAANQLHFYSQLLDNNDKLENIISRLF